MSWPWPWVLFPCQLRIPTFPKAIHGGESPRSTLPRGRKHGRLSGLHHKVGLESRRPLNRAHNSPERTGRGEAMGGATPASSITIRSSRSSSSEIISSDCGRISVGCGMRAGHGTYKHLLRLAARGLALPIDGQVRALGPRAAQNRHLRFTLGGRFAV